MRTRRSRLRSPRACGRDPQGKWWSSGRWVWRWCRPGSDNAFPNGWQRRETRMSIGAARPATHARLYEQPPDIVEEDGTRSWVTRARNFAVVVSQAKPGTMLERDDN